jgi:phosphatidylserine/phosphatidylglycerophosphate/cardiolipin synthase-like enzyme
MNPETPEKEPAKREGAVAARLGASGAVLVVILLVASAMLGSADWGPVLQELVDNLLAAEQPLPTVAIAPHWYDIYFTAPTCPPLEERIGGLDSVIAKDILAAQKQVDIAAFDLDAEPIVNALITLEERGIIVRVVTDEDNGDLSSIHRLRRHGISVVEDKRSGLMHDKFIVIDDRYVWTGSLNFTSNGIYCNNNNIVRFDAPLLAENYSTEMDEMYDERLFGPDSPDNTPYPEMTIHGVLVQNAFAPEKRLVPMVSRAVAGAEKEILFLTFAFTSKEIGEAMLGRADAGVDVRGIFETVGSENEFSYYTIAGREDLANVDVRQDPSSGLMHHKVFIIDRQTVVFGSFNFTDSANRKNDENIVIVHDPAFAAPFVQEFERIWQQTSDFTGTVTP